MGLVGGGGAQQRVRNLALKRHKERSKEEKKELVDAAIAEWESVEYKTRHLRGVSKLATKYNYPKASLRKFVAGEQRTATIGECGRHTFVHPRVFRGLAQCADDCAKSANGLSGVTVRSQPQRDAVG